MAMGRGGDAPRRGVSGTGRGGIVVFIPNILSLARLLSVPVAIMLMLDGSYALCFWLFVAAGVTDAVDGWFAKTFDARTQFGAFLDPLADKVLALGGLWAVVLAGRFWWLPVALVTARELLISGFRSYWGRRGLAVPASRAAKFKTFLQFSSVSLVVWPWTTGITWMADTVLWLAVLVAWVSAVQYVVAGSRATSTTGAA